MEASSNDSALGVPYIMNDVEQIDENPLKRKKKSETSKVWEDFIEMTLPDGQIKNQCVHCKYLLGALKSKSTTHLQRHLDVRVKKKLHKREEQQRIQFQPTTSNPEFLRMTPALVDGKFDVLKMREVMAQWVLMHEHPFSIVEEEGFNMMQEREMLDWEKISRITCKRDCQLVYEKEKQKLKAILKSIDKVSLTTDLWKSTNQKIEYAVITCHFVDRKWKLQKRIINFVHIPPSRRGIEISDCLYKCLQGRELEKKVLTISVDNASCNDSAIKLLKETFSMSKKLLYGGKLFHVRCCAHILNLLVQDGPSQIKDIIEDVRESISYIHQSDSRLKTFCEIVQQLQLPSRRLVLNCRTRWNSTYVMLSTAIKFKDVFPRYMARDPHYYCCPRPEDWEKVEKISQILEVFNSATKVISGSEYPTSNLFLNEVRPLKILLDSKSQDEDEFVRSMALKMKVKFDKYWGECNLLMAIGAIFGSSMQDESD